MEFIPSDDLNAFGFFDPNEIIRAAHLILVFHHGAPESLLDRGSRGGSRRSTAGDASTLICKQFSMEWNTLK